jgi:glycerol-3-phosphate dehydrogenase
MITITGGKWTTYRKMAEDVVDIAAATAGLPVKESTTHELKLYGHDQPVPAASLEGMNDAELTAFIKKTVEDEQCVTVEDFLSRRSRQLLLDAKLAIRSAPKVAALMAALLQKEDAWAAEQITAFNNIANNYLPS